MARDVLHFFTVLPWRTASGSSHPQLLSSQVPSFPQTEQFLLTVMHEFLHFVLHVTFCFLCHFVNIPRILFASFAFFFCSRNSSSCCFSLSYSSIARATWRTRFLFVSFSRLCCSRQHERVDACLCDLLCILIPTCLALVTVRTLALTNPGSPSSHAANPNMHRSATVVLIPGMVMIFVTHFILELTSDVSSCTTVATARNLRFIQLAQEFHVILVLLSAPPCSDLCRTQ